MATRTNSQEQPAAATTRQPTTSVLRSAVFYQNRIIVPDRKTSNSKTRQAQEAGIYRHNQAASSIGTAASKQSNTNNNDRPEADIGLRSGGDCGVKRCVVCARVCHNRNDIKCSKCSSLPWNGSGMESHGVDIVVTDTDTDKEEKEDSPSCCKRFYLCLQDNRMKGNPDAEKILASSNPEDFKVLKKVLNISFLTIGIALLVAVVIVILYTTIDAIGIQNISYKKTSDSTSDRQLRRNRDIANC